MKKLCFQSLILVLMGVLVFTGCKKAGCNKTCATNYDSSADKDDGSCKGCTDTDAKNYCASAILITNDGSCKFEGEIIFWYGKTTSENLFACGSSNLKFYVDSKLLGSTAATVYLTGTPSCGNSAAITVIENLGNSKSKSFSYSIIDDLGYEMWKGTDNFSANTCLNIELRWSEILPSSGC